MMQIKKRPTNETGRIRNQREDFKVSMHMRLKLTADIKTGLES